jgi:transcriptional regulator with XRE-family HTH domain
MKSEERREVGRRIRAVRQRQGWGREEMARRLGVHAGSIARWETGGALPHGYNVQRIAELGGTTAEWLRTGDRFAGAARETRQEEGEVFSANAMKRFLSAIASPGSEMPRKLDALDGLRRMLTAKGALPGWWYELKSAVESGRS